MKNQFSTLNESSLHKSLKKLYSLDEGSRTEVELDGYIYDIVTKENDVIEIQNLNVSKLKDKIITALNNNRKIKIVHPVISKKIIETYTSDQKLLHRRTSPKKETIYSVLKELTGIHPLLLKEGFTLELPFISMTEKRIKTEEPVQTKNKKRHFKRDWIKTDKKLKEIFETRCLCSRGDYLNLLPKDIPESFTTSDIRAALRQQKKTSQADLKNINLLVWLLSRMEIIEPCGKKGNSIIYKVKQT